MIIAGSCASRTFLRLPLTFSVGVISALFLVALRAGSPLHASELPGINGSPDPYELYGDCSEGGEFRSKQDLVYEAGRDLRNVLAIVVLECSGAIGGGGTNVVACPSGSPYAYCLFNDNDGAGNLVRLGVLQLNGVTAPTAGYRGCPSGARIRSKAAVVSEAAADLRLVKAIVTLRCRAANGPPGASIVECPQGPSPYAYCVRSNDDGRGNAVLLGVADTEGAGDPFGLYGECHPGAHSGYRAKADILRDIGMSTADVRAIDLITCFGPGTAPTIPTSLVRVPCSSIPLQDQLHYDSCIWGADEKENYLIVGVVTAPRTAP